MTSKGLRLLLLTGLGFLLGFMGLMTFNQEGSLVVYSSRQEYLIKPLLTQFEEETGIKTTLFTGAAGPLIERLKTEASRPNADVFITVDAGNLWYASQEGLLAPIKSETINATIPSSLRDPEDRWVGLSMRARPIIYNTKTVDPSELHSYEALSDAKWKGRLVLRTAKKVYNQALVAMMIDTMGEADTLAILKGWVSNLASPVFSSDTQVIEAIEAGQGDVGIVNTYYFGRYQETNPKTTLALYFPTASKIGVHVNISGAGIVKGSKRHRDARRLLEWLTGPEAQRILADSNLEYPANPAVESSDAVKSWGVFVPSALPVYKTGMLQSDAIRVMSQAGYE